MKRFLLLFGLCILCLGFVSAVHIENNYFSIDCSPDIATIQYGGFNAQCDFTYKGSDTINKDLVFCFNTPLDSFNFNYVSIDGIVNYNDGVGYKNFLKNQGDCYYIKYLPLSNIPLHFSLSYLPSNFSVVPEWSTYIGDVKEDNPIEIIDNPLLKTKVSIVKGVETREILVPIIEVDKEDLILDPLYDSNNYEIGTNRATNYYWISNGVVNGDILSYNANMCFNNVSNSYCSWSKTEPDSPGIAPVSGYTTLFQYNNLSEYRSTVSVNVNTVSADPGYRYTARMIYYYNDSTSETYNGSTCQFLSVPISLNYNSNSSKKVLNVSIQAATWGDFTCTTPAVYTNYIYTSLSKTAYMNVLNNFNSTIVSNPIALGNLVNNFRINSSFIGQAFINLSFDGNKWVYMNLSNSSLNNYTGNISVSNTLQYKLYLLDNKTTINNFSIYFNGLNNFLQITVYDESTGLIINKNISVTLTTASSQTNFILLNGTGNISNVISDDYTMLFQAQGYSIKTYANPSSNKVYNYLNVYMNNGSLVLFNIYDKSGTVISNAFFQLYSYVNSTLVLVGSGLSDTSGKVTFSYLPNTYYAYNVSKDGYSSYYDFLNPIQFSSYDIRMSSYNNASTSPSVIVSFNPSSYRKYATNNFYISFSSGNNRLVSYDYTLNYLSGIASGNGSNISGESFNNNVYITSGTGSSKVVLSYHYVLNDGSSYNNSLSFPLIITSSNHTIIASSTKDYGFLIGDKVLLIALILLPIMGVFWLAGGFFMSLTIGGIFLGILLNSNLLSSSELPLYYGSIVLIGFLLIFRGRT